MAGFLNAFLGEGPSPADDDGTDFETRSAQAVPADVRMFSGCKDSQTSADVYDTAQFGLPEDAGPGGAGGACTNSIIASFEQNGSGMSWVQLLQSMRRILSEKNYTQIPQLSSSRNLDLNSTFDLTQGGNLKSCLVGINYIGQQGELRGCINDVLTMKTFLDSQGFPDDEDHQRILRDDGEGINPDRANLKEAMQWLVAGAQPGDSLFFHYSGHGGQARDSGGDEADGYDETMIPVDYQSAGMVRDDEIFKELVAPLPDGVQLTVIMDCCHSGSILDLPFMFKATEDAVESEDPPQMQVNPKFDFQKLLKFAQDLYTIHQSGGGLEQMAGAAFKAFF